MVTDWAKLQNFSHDTAGVWTHNIANETRANDGLFTILENIRFSLVFWGPKTFLSERKLNLNFLHFTNMEEEMRH